MIDPNDHNAIHDLTIGEIAFPNIDYTNFPELQLDQTTLHGAYRIIRNSVNEEFLIGLNWVENGNLEWQLTKLHEIANTITRMIFNYREEPNEFLLKKIFIWIQLWGGKGGRSVFIRGQRWPNNFDATLYSNAVASILSHDYINALNTLNQIWGVKTAFSTKHLNFWSNGDAPIFDSIISKLIFGRDTVRAIDYTNYIFAIDDLINILDQQSQPNISRGLIERNLFNWANTEEGKTWIQIRLTR